MNLQRRLIAIVGSTLVLSVAALLVVGVAVFRGVAADAAGDRLERTLGHLVLALVAASAVLIVATLVALQRLVLARLTRLGTEISRLHATGDLGLRVTVEGADELSRLCTSINDLLAATESTQRRVLESEQHFREMADCSPMMVWMTDAEKRVTYVSTSWLDFTGRSLGANLGDGWAHSVHPDDRNDSLRIFFEAFDSRGTYRNEYRLRRHDGAYRWILAQGVPLVAASGEFRGYIGSCIDITDRREMEDALRTAQQAATRASDAKSAFLANMSHEIRTPMTAILGYADLLAQSLGGAANAALPPGTPVAEALDAIRRNSEHLLALINDVLDMSKIEAGRMSVERTACSLPDVLRDVTALVRERAAAAGVALQFDFRSGIPELVLSDPLRLRQVLVNLISNAIKFSPGGRVSISSSYLRADDPAHSRLQFDIADNGIGMSPEQIRSIFAEFYQAEASIARRFGGTGLGLSISRTLARLLGGDITVSSTPGAGSVFTFTAAAPAAPGSRWIPLDRHALEGVLTAQSPRQPDSPPPLTVAARVLLADDSPDNQRLIAFMLRAAGMTVEIADNGQRAVDLCLGAQRDGRPFDLILMDVQMPLFDGLEATRRLRAAGVRTPIAALTAHALSEDRARSLDAGCDDHLTKPVNRAVLIERCAQLIRAGRSAASEPERVADGTRTRDPENHNLVL